MLTLWWSSMPNVQSTLSYKGQWLWFGQVVICSCHIAGTHRRWCPGYAGLRGRKPCTVVPVSSLPPLAVGIWRVGATTVVVSATWGCFLYLYHQYSKASVTHAMPMPTNMTMKTPPVTMRSNIQYLAWIYRQKMGHDLRKMNSKNMLNLRNSLASFSKYLRFFTRFYNVYILILS
jgi:hypothetical protein